MVLEISFKIMSLRIRPLEGTAAFTVLQECGHGSTWGPSLFTATTHKSTAWSPWTKLNLSIFTLIILLVLLAQCLHLLFRLRRTKSNLILQQIYFNSYFFHSDIHTWVLHASILLKTTDKIHIQYQHQHDVVTQAQHANILKIQIKEFPKSVVKNEIRPSETHNK